MDAMLMSRTDAVSNPLLTSLQSLGSIGLPVSTRQYTLDYPNLSRPAYRLYCFILSDK